MAHALMDMSESGEYLATAKETSALGRGRGCRRCEKERKIRDQEGLNGVERGKVEEGVWDK